MREGYSHRKKKQRVKSEIDREKRKMEGEKSEREGEIKIER